MFDFLRKKKREELELPPSVLEAPITFPKFEMEEPGMVKAAPEKPSVTRPRQKEVFVNVESFKTLVFDLNNIKNDLRDYQKDIEEFELTRREEEKTLEKWKKSVQEVQTTLTRVCKVRNEEKNA